VGLVVAILVDPSSSSYLSSSPDADAAVVEVDGPYSAADVPGRWFDRVLIFMFENHAYDEVIKNPDFSKYAKKGRQFTDYYAVTHPSQPNYWCQTSGDYYSINSDKNFNLDKSNIVDLLDKKRISWKAYMEDYPGQCNAQEKVGKYYRKHNPFISYDNIRNNATRCAHIVNSKEFDSDLVNGTLPQFMYFTPNIDNDCHDTDIPYGGRWLNNFLTLRLPKFPKGMLTIVTWDEDDKTEGNKIDTYMLGSMITPLSSDGAFYNHFSLLRTIEDNWQLGTLNRNDAQAVPFKF